MHIHMSPLTDTIDMVLVTIGCSAVSVNNFLKGWWGNKHGKT